MNLAVTDNQIESFLDDAELITAWMLDKSTTTQKVYQITITQLFAATGKDSLREIGVRDILKWRQSLEVYSPSTVVNKMAIIKSLYSFAVKLSYLNKNPTLGFKAPKTRDPLHERLIEKNDVEKLLTHCSDLRFKMLFQLIAIAGLRIKEALDLKWSDARILENKVLIIVNGKGNKTRTVPIELELWSEISQLKGNSQFIFSTSTGKPIDKPAAHNMLKKAARLAEINQKVSCHWLRHFCATERIYQGQPINEVSKLLGHKDVAITSRYLHVLDDNMRTDYIQLVF